ncbi:DUF1707 domain-containing protein [Nocardioides sp. AE5]|uniref:DUF1707 SHOCT-like domain-containing protein n=1 Tax=Nocardioides sp. AE5 TaxID=2962573 RepID=UPI002881EB58|nr:DUF1707 domain-containing protein [Nocardioides sp. AE5]MDT0202219.1 DUF1707 domain-containing protein [Nocardioides sp. AE5]
MDDPSRMRISDADRHNVAEVLREAAGEGRLDLAELDERLEAAYAAKTYGDLVPLTADLPAKGLDLAGATAPAPVPATGGGAPVVGTRYNSSIAVMGGVERKGVWELGETHTVFALMAGVVIDLRRAIFTAPRRW